MYQVNSEKNIARGVHAVALFEAIKGAIVLAAGFGLLALLHRDFRPSPNASSNFRTSIPLIITRLSSSKRCLG